MRQGESLLPHRDADLGNSCASHFPNAPQKWNLLRNTFWGERDFKGTEIIGQTELGVGNTVDIPTSLSPLARTGGQELRSGLATLSHPVATVTPQHGELPGPRAAFSPGSDMFGSPLPVSSRAVAMPSSSPSAAATMFVEPRRTSSRVGLNNMPFRDEGFNFIHSLCHVNESLSRDKELLVKDNELLKSDNDSLKSENDSLKSEKESLEREKVSLERDNESLETRLRQFEKLAQERLEAIERLENYQNGILSLFSSSHSVEEELPISSNQLPDFEYPLPQQGAEVSTHPDPGQGRLSHGIDSQLNFDLNTMNFQPIFNPFMRDISIDLATISLPATNAGGSAPRYVTPNPPAASGASVQGQRERTSLDARMAAPTGSGNKHGPTVDRPPTDSGYDTSSLVDNMGYSGPNYKI